MQILSVADASSYVRDLLEADLLLSDLWVAGEISNLSRSTAGHLYFTLKDASAQLRSVVFRHAARFPAIKNGDAVVAHGHVSFWGGGGSLQFYVDVVQPEGVGLLHLQYERLRAQLDEEGLFDPSRKRPLPSFPRRIGVVTSPTGAVWRDICNVSARRYPLVELVLAPCAVQGEGSAAAVARAIHELNLLAGIDVIIVARGGGSLEDLWSFNEEIVARAIFASRVPVVTGVGHETDTTIADYVADLRAPTPSAAAELCLPDVRDLREQLLSAIAALDNGLFRFLESRRSHVRYLEYETERLAPDVAANGDRLDHLRRLAINLVTAKLNQTRQQIEARSQSLRALSPLDVLSRGYAILELEASGTAVHSASQVCVNELVTATLHDGRIRARVVE